jgi:hypothetical protein
MINGTFNETILNFIKSTHTDFMINEFDFYRPDGVNYNETLANYVNDALDDYFKALKSANPPYTEEKHTTFNETIDKMKDGFQTLMGSFKGLEKLFRPEINQMPIVYEFLRVFNETFTHLDSFKEDPTGYGDYWKVPANVKLTATLYY